LPSLTLKNNEFGDHLKKISNYHFLYLLLIGICAFSIRLIFFQNDLIFTTDNIHYFNYAIDVSITGELPTTLVIQNNGWPLFLSVFFKFLDSENFLHYMNLQSYLTMIFSTLTIIPLYFLAKKFVGTSFALFTTILFVFEPRIIQNSLLGATDPLFVLLIVTSLALAIQKNKYSIFIAFGIAAFSSVIRAEGLFLIPALYLMFFSRFKISRKSILQCIIFLAIIFLILLPFSIQRIENSGNDYLIGRIIQSSTEFSTQTQNEPSQILSKIGESIYLFLGFLGRIMIPYLWIFVPIGIILFFKKNNIHKSLLIIPVFFLSLPILYAYSVPALDSRYLFSILPILCIFGTFSYMKIFEKMKYKKILTVIIVIIIIFSSILFLDYKNYNAENQQEFLELAGIINKKTDIILYINSPINPYLDLARLLELEKFPVTSMHYDKNLTKYVNVDDFDVEEFFVNMEKNEITHIVIDEEINNPSILKKIFNDFKKYENLKKVFDSKEEGYNYNMKIYKIDYN